MGTEAAESAAGTLAELAPRLGRLIARALEADLDVALSLRQYRMLERLAAGARRTSDLAMTSGVSQPTASAAAGSLVERGLVARVSDPVDRRATLIMLTDTGRAVLEVAQGRVMDRLMQVTREVTPEQAQALAKLQPVLTAGLDRAWEEMRKVRHPELLPGPNDAAST